jgi:hypothetical protein
MKANVLINNMNTGEVSPLIESRSDLSKYAAACKTLENAIPLVEGGAKKMPGTIFAGIAGNGGPLGTPTTGKSRLVPFEFSTNQTAVLEFFAGGIRIWIDGGLVLGSAAGLSDWTPGTTYPAATQVLLGTYTRLSTTSTPSAPYLTLQAPYSEGGLSNVLITLGVNSSDTLAVTKTGATPNQGIQILLANTTSANNSSTAIQAAIQALHYLNSPSRNYISLALWQAYWDPTSSTPPITSVRVTQAMDGSSGLIFQSLVASNTDNFPPLSPSGWEAIAPNEPIVVATPYAEGDLFALDVSTQSADVLYIVHALYPPASLSRYSDTTWVYQPLALYGTTDVVKTGYSALGQPISAILKANPAVVTVASAQLPADFINGARIYINECAGMVEFNAGQFILSNLGGSAGAFTFNLLPLGAVGGGPVGTVGGPIGSPTFPVNPAGTYAATGGSGTGLTLTIETEPISGDFSLWRITAIYVANPGTGYNVGDVVGASGSGWGVATQVTSIIGSAAIDSTNFLDYTGGGYAVALDILFVGAGNYPACNTLYQERYCLAGALNIPTQMNGSVQDDYPDFICDPNEDDYAIQFTLVSQQVNPIRWMIGTPTALMLGTSGGVWAMFTADGSALSQTDVTAALQTTIGTGNVAPQLVNSDIIWVTRSAKMVRLLVFNFITNQWEGPDLTRLNRYITRGPTEALSGIVQTAFQAEPYPIFWAVRADGQLLALTYERQEEVFAWCRIVTDGVIESVAVVSQDNAEDQIWISVLRTINGVQQRYIEYFAQMELFSQLSNAFFVHAGLQWQGAGPFNITGITNANPAVVTAPGHTLQNGESIAIADVEGMTQANTDPLTAWAVAGVSGNTFELQGIDSTGWGVYAGGGTVEQVTNQVTGMQYLAAKMVVAVGDEQVIFNGPAPTSGTVVFGSYANAITIGLPFTTTIQPMNPVLGSPQATSKGKRQKFYRATISLFESVGGQIGTDSSHLHDIEYGQNTLGNPPALFTGNLTHDLDGEWGEEDTILIVHSDPYPLTLRSVTPRLAVSEEG